VTAPSPEEIIWFRAFGLERLLAHASAADRLAWEGDVARAMMPDADAMLRIGGVTRFVRARPRQLCAR
jgi:hypothetical protein